MKNLYRYEGEYHKSFAYHNYITGTYLPGEELVPGKHYWRDRLLPGDVLIPEIDYDGSKTIAENVARFHTWRNTDATSPDWDDALQLAEGFFEGLMDAARKAEYRECLPDPATLTEEKARVLLIALEGPKPPKRFDMSIDRMEITLDGRTFPCRSEQALLMLQVYAEHPGQWFTAKQVEKHTNGQVSSEKVGVLKGKLPPEIRRLIQGDTHHGSRIVLPPL